MTARSAALNVLLKVKNGAFLNLAMKDGLFGLSLIEKRFAAALIKTTLENLIRIDYIIAQFYIGKLHKTVAAVLELGVCQLMFFESVPTSAAVNESVKLLKKSPKRELAGFVNSVLRRISEGIGSIKYPDESDTISYLSVMSSYPEWIVEMITRQYGRTTAEEILVYRNEKLGTCVRVRNPEVVLENATPGKYLSDANYLHGVDGIETLPEFLSGEISPMGEASMLCAKLAGIKPGDKVLDVCAAPGGKSAYCADLGAQVTALELHEHRINLMHQNFSRLGLEISVMRADATEFLPEFEGKFDVVLCDVPCSALGLAYRKPDIKFSKSLKLTDELLKIQASILKNCSRYIKSGGKLVYSTCTINKEENVAQTDLFLENNADFCYGKLAADGIISTDNPGYIQLLPPIHGVDGFYISVMERK